MESSLQGILSQLEELVEEENDETTKETEQLGH